MLAVFASSLPAKCQTVDSLTVSVRDSLREAKAKNRMVRVEVFSETMTGRVQRLDGNALRLGQRNISISDITRLEIRHSSPDRLWDGALVGAAVTAVILGPIAVGLAETLGERQLSFAETIPLFAGAAGFGVLFGGAIDAAREPPATWRIVYERRP